MHPATLHGVCVITKLYFVIVAAFEESMTLNLAQRSFKVIHFGGNRKPVYDFVKAVSLIVTFALSLTVSEILSVLCYAQRPEPIFPNLTPIPANICKCSLWSRSVMVGSGERRKVKLINRAIVFQEFQPRPV